jgi:hypothetical protein
MELPIDPDASKSPNLPEASPNQSDSELILPIEEKGPIPNSSQPQAPADVESGNAAAPNSPNTQNLYQPFVSSDDDEIHIKSSSDLAENLQIRFEDKGFSNTEKAALQATPVEIIREPSRSLVDTKDFVITYLGSSSSEFDPIDSEPIFCWPRENVQVSDAKDVTHVLDGEKNKLGTNSQEQDPEESTVSSIIDPKTSRKIFKKVNKITSAHFAEFDFSKKKETLLKTLQDVKELRQRLLSAMEEAKEAEASPTVDEAGEIGERDNPQISQKTRQNAYLKNERKVALSSIAISLYYALFPQNYRGLLIERYWGAIYSIMKKVRINLPSLPKIDRA